MGDEVGSGLWVVDCRLGPAIAIYVIVEETKFGPVLREEGTSSPADLTPTIQELLRRRAPRAVWIRHAPLRAELREEHGLADGVVLESNIPALATASNVASKWLAQKVSTLRESLEHSRLVVATDGSWSERTQTCGYAYICEDGSYGVGADTWLPGSSGAEMMAIRLALKQFSPKQALHIISDSRSAVESLSDTRRHRLLSSDKIARMLARRDVTFEWVRGHAGHPLNEGADRLSRAIRRQREWGGDPESFREICRNIVRESLEAS